jgi:hypothetical protein
LVRAKAYAKLLQIERVRKKQEERTKLLPYEGIAKGVKHGERRSVGK